MYLSGYVGSTCKCRVNTDTDTDIAYFFTVHYSDVMIRAMASQITGVWIVYSIVCSGADQRKHLSSASLAFVRGIHRWPVNSPHKEPVARKMVPFDDVMLWGSPPPLLPIRSLSIWSLMWEVVRIVEYVPHWGRVTLICVSKLSILGSDNGLSPCRRQAII